MTITLALQQHVPAAALRGTSRWLYAGDDPSFDLPGLERVATADTAMEAARELRAPFLDWIGGLSRANASPEWWASYLSAKQSYPSLFARLCGLAAARELATDGTLIVCSTAAQLAELKLMLERSRTKGLAVSDLRRRARATALRIMWPTLERCADRAPAVLRALAATGQEPRFVLQQVQGHRRQTLRAIGAAPLPPFGGEATALLVTWIDHRCFDSNGRYHDPHLGPLGAMLTDRGLRVARIVKPLLHTPLAQSARALLSSGEPAAFSDLYVSADEWRACARRFNRARFAIPRDTSVDGLPVALLAREYVAELRREQVDALSHEVLVANLRAGGVEPELIIFPWEGHPWEQVLIGAVRHHMPDTKVVAYDNLNFSTLALSLYPSPLELEVRPLPDRVVTNGPTFAEVLRRNGFPADRVSVGCALRHSVGAGANGGRLFPRGESSFVLAAGTIHAAQTVELLRKTSEAFGDQLVARLHPASDGRAIRGALPASIRYADEPLSELLSQARLMLYNYSAVAYDALAAGVPPVFVRSESGLDMDQLEPSPDVRWVARTVAELRAVALEIDSLADRDAWERRAHEVVIAALAPAGPGCADAFLCRDAPLARD